MYTEKSVELKNDFYKGFGETHGKLYFEHVMMPCILMGDERFMLAFSFDCGVRAYGRPYGDILRVMRSDSNICDVHFVKNGKGAQIMYSPDAADIPELRPTAIYAINKLLCRMESTGRLHESAGIMPLMEEYAQKGWAAVREYDNVKSVPLPLNDYNVLLIRPRKIRLSRDSELRERFLTGEKERIGYCKEALKELNLNAFFEVINESERSLERLLMPTDDIVNTVKATQSADGVCAVKICDCGIVCFCRKEATDSVIVRVKNECQKKVGYAVRVIVVK